MNHIGLNGVLAVFSVIVVAALVACSGESSCTVETKLLEDESAGTSSSVEKLPSSSSRLPESSSSSISSSFSSSSATPSSDSESANCKGVVFDSKKQICDGRDKKVYKIATIGNQVWMAENLNFDYKLGGNSYGAFCYDDDSDNCSKYGRLYTWAAAMDSAGLYSEAGKGCGYNVDGYADGVETCVKSRPVRGACPAGWHMPTIVEWEALLKKVESGLALKTKTGWNDASAGKSGNGTDEYGFGALPAGFRFGPDDVSEEDIQNGESPYDGILKSADFWSSTEDDETSASTVSVYNDKEYVDINVGFYENYAFAVRCVKD